MLTVESWKSESVTNVLGCNVWGLKAVMHDKGSSLEPETSVSGALIHPSTAQEVWGVYVCMFSSGTFSLNAGHQTRLFSGKSSILYRKYPYLPAVCVTC